jgi:glucose/arabinose dehydrogenase
MYFFGALDDPGDPTPQAKPTAAAHRIPEWKKDAPGRVYRLDPRSLPPPFDTPSAHNFAKFVERPPGARLRLPKGFRIDVYAAGLLGPRKMLVVPNGDVLVSETSGGRITILHPSADGTRAVRSDVYAEHLKQPFGLTFYPDAAHAEWLYVAENDRVVRFRWREGENKTTAEPELVAVLPSGGGHFTRDLAFSENGRWLFVSVGSASNAGESLPKKTAAETRVWQSTHAKGAAWAGETNRANVLVYDVRDLGQPSGAPVPGVYATGLRNCVSLTVQPATGDLWCTTNERDRLGDDLVPDYATRVREGGFYGWPWYYLGAHEDPHLKGERPDLADSVRVPDVLFQSHSAALNLTFYQATSGKSAFPKEYIGDAFAAFHGSWNRSLRTGHKLVRVHMKDGEPTGSYSDFLTGFIVNEGDAWGRPVATTELPDGSLLMSDDGGNLIYRISYRRP